MPVHGPKARRKNSHNDARNLNEASGILKKKITHFSPLGNNVTLKANALGNVALNDTKASSESG